MSQFEVGDIVVITHEGNPRELCILGKVLRVGLTEPYEQCIQVDYIWKHDPQARDSFNVGFWPTNSDYITIERCGPDGAV